MTKLSVVLAWLVSAAALFSCAKPADSAASQSAPAANDKSNQLYIEVSALGNLGYFYDHKMGMQKVGEEMGVKTEYVGPAEYDMAAMVNAFEQAIAKKPNGIVVVGFEESLNSIIDKAIAAGIPVVTVDADLPNSKRLAFVGTGNANAGRAGAAKLAQEIGGQGKVAIMTKPGQSNLEERVTGYREELAKYPGIQIVQIADTQSDSVVAPRLRRRSCRGSRISPALLA